MSTLLAAAPVGAHVPPPDDPRDAGLHKALGALGEGARASGLQNQAPPSAPTPLLAEHFEVLGHNNLGGQDTNGDVWVHGNFAYVGTWSRPCTGRGVKIVDVSDLSAPRVIGALAARPGTSAEDVVVRRVQTSSFTGDLLAVGIQRCGGEPALDKQQFGAEFWDVTNPSRPRQLGVLGVANGDEGVHELDLIQRGNRVYALLASEFTEWLDPVPGGDFRIADVTDPRRPVVVGQWWAKAHGLSRGPWAGQGSYGATYAHSVRASEDGNTAYVSYWDLGVLTLDIRDVTKPVLTGRTRFSAEDDGDAHSVALYRAGSKSFLLQNDEDWDPRSMARIRYGAAGEGLASEAPDSAALWLKPDHRVSGAVVQAANEGCSATDYPAGTAGKIAVVRTPFPYFDPQGGPDPLCTQEQQEASAEAAGAIAVVHDVISTSSSPQWWDSGAPNIPVLFADHGTAQGMVAAGAATLEALPPSWGFLRVYDAATGAQVAKFDALPNVHTLPAPHGLWSIHNTEVVEDRAYSSWYSNGVVALDLGPLNRVTPGDPTLVGRFLPAGAPSRISRLPSNVPLVWGVAVRPSDQVISVSDMNSGLWIVKPTGPAAPTAP